MSRARNPDSLTTRCLPPEILRAYVRGDLGDEQAELANEHIAGCPQCRAATEAEYASDDLASGLRAAYERDPHLIPADDPANGGAPVALSPDAVPGYDIRHEIHRGGQGVVFEAEQLATKRTVALKVLLHGAFASPRQRRRFEREIEMVAGLHHPHIVTIYESGLIADDRPYFAMEYIDGVPLSEYVRQRRQARHLDGGLMSPGELLRLVLKICAAVGYAHQRGLIHRDLKPSNILIDAAGDPHILDFGLAKAVTANARESRGSVTAVGEFMGTIAYASPEQVQGDPQLDVRSDVYSLGVILYEVLTGQFPYDVGGALGDVLNNIASAIPEPPRLWWERHRRGDERTADQIPFRVPSDLETIVLKCLNKEVDRRYESVADLARDISHYLAGEPIEARRDSNWYVLKKTLHRHRLTVVVALAFVAMLFEMVIVSLWAWRQAALEIDRTKQERVATLENRAQVEAQRLATEAARADLSLVVAFQNRLLRDMNAAALGPNVIERMRQHVNSPYAGRGADIEITEAVRQTLRETVLAPAEADLEQEFADRPLIRARLRATLGALYRELGDRDGSARNFRQALQLVRDLLGPPGEPPRRADLTVTTFERFALYTLAEAALLDVYSSTAAAADGDDYFDIRRSSATMLAELYAAWEKREQSQHWQRTSWSTTQPATSPQP